MTQFSKYGLDMQTVSKPLYVQNNRTKEEMYDGRNWKKIRVDHIRRNLLLLVRDFVNKWLLHSQREIAYIIFFCSG